MTEFLIACIVMLAIGVILAALLAYADKKLYVYEDPRIDEVEALLPKANCGACGSAGCRAFAEKLVRGEASPSKCTVSSEDALIAIATLLQVDRGSEERRVARLACAGDEGLQACRAAALISGGGKVCAWGCLGLADCERACSFEAIHMDEHSLPVVSEALCTACGDCVVACPKDLFSLHPVSHRLWVACRSLFEGALAESECDVACTGCGRCALDAPAGLIQMVDHLAVIDYSRNQLATTAPTQRCPTGAIVWMDARRGPIKGVEAKVITRRTPLPVELADLPLSAVGAGVARELPN